MQLPASLRQALRAVARADLRDFQVDARNEEYGSKLMVAWEYADALEPSELAVGLGARAIENAFCQHPEEARQAYVLYLMQFSKD